HRFDNTQGDSNLRGIYRWVNKVYVNRVSKYGQRLIIEFIVREPASSYKLSQRRLHGEDLVRPPSLEALGIYSFLDVTRGNYAKVAAAYSVTDVQPPPPAVLSVTAAFTADQLLSSQQIAIPAGYRTFSATIGYALPPSSGVTAINGIIGTEAFDIVVKSPPHAETIPFRTDSRSIPVSLTE